MTANGAAEGTADRSLDRRSFMKALSAACAVPLTPGTGGLPAPVIGPSAEVGRRRRAHSPNVVIMICDDLGYGDLGCYGSRVPTPSLDRMAGEGTRFSRFNAAHPLCSASRSALLTGRYAQRTHTRSVYFPHDKSGMSLEETTLANLFHAEGYQTHCIGKWHLGDAPEYLPTSRGFDSFFGVPYSVDMQPLPLRRDRAAELTIVEEDTDRHLLTPRYTEEALRLLDAAGDKPFFLYLAFSYPHDPARASARFAGKSGLGDSGDAIMEIDWGAGEVLQALKRNNLDADTIVLFTSDHGPWFQGSPGALRGRKGSTFEGGFRVPLLARWPGQIPPGRAVDAWGSNLDLVPTLVELCGLKLPERPLDGANIASLLTRSDAAVARKPILYFSTFGDKSADLHCIRDENWKLRVAQGDGEIYITDNGNGHRSAWLPHPELYDLERDPEESYDLAKQNPERVQQMLASVEEVMPTFPPDIVAAYGALKQNVARRTTPPGAAFRPQTDKPLPSWAWEPADRRG